MRDLDTTSLRLFAAVCDSGSITLAGEREGIAGSAISKRLALLEHTLGARLFERHRRGLVPTAAADTLLKHARAILATQERIARDMAGYASGLRGQVRVLASASVLAESLAGDLADFLGQPRHAQIRVDVEERTSTEVLRGVREGSASLGVCWDAADCAGLDGLPYRRDRLGVVVHPRHRLARRRRVRVADLLDCEHVGLPAHSAVLLRLQRAAALAGGRLAYRMQVSTFDAALRVVAAGLAVSVVPVEAASVRAAAGALRVLALDEDWAARQFVVCLRPGSPPAAQALAQHLAACAAPG